MERRLSCEQLLPKTAKHKAGVYDEPMRLTVGRFQQKHMIYEAAGIIEEGSGGTNTSPAQNLAHDYTAAALQQLGLTDTASALAFFERHAPERFQTLLAAMKADPRPRQAQDRQRSVDEHREL